MRTVKFKYNIGDRVHVIAVEMAGRVDAMIFDHSGGQYRVIYWHNGERYAIWMYDWEISK